MPMKCRQVGSVALACLFNPVHTGSFRCGAANELRWGRNTTLSHDGVIPLADRAQGKLAPSVILTWFGGPYLLSRFRSARLRPPWPASASAGVPCSRGRLSQRRAPLAWLSNHPQRRCAAFPISRLFQAKGFFSYQEYGCSPQDCNPFTALYSALAIGTNPADADC